MEMPRMFFLGCLQDKAVCGDIQITGFIYVSTVIV